MPGLIRSSDVEEVKARTNIADVIGDFVNLRTAGVGSLKGLCPFHDERSPSFHVRPQVGYYHCFGCGESGDVYSFLQKMDHVTFADAVERLAAKIGYQLSYEDGAAAADHSGRARLLAANDAAEEFFRSRLATAGAAPARAFLGERGFDQAAAERFGVGYAPKSWDELTGHLRSKGFTQEELAGAGLVSTGDRGVYDRFRGRLVWPIRDITGQTVGFGARRLLDDDKGPKYLNTPETAVYHKAQVLYGLHLAKRDISRNHQVVVVEGYTDVMACHLAGVTTAVATCGTSFGVDHIKVLRRVLGDDSSSGEVVFTFDADAAGQSAALRAFAEEQRFTAQTYVALAPAGLDPCDLRLQHGNDAVVRMIERKKPMFEFVLRETVGRFDLDTVEGRVAALRAAAPVIAGMRDAALRPSYTRELARMLGMELGEVSRAVAAGRTASPRKGEASAPERAPAAAAGLRDLPNDPAARVEREALMAMVQHPELVGESLLAKAVSTRFSNASLAVVRDGIAATADSIDRPGWLERLIAEVPEPYRLLVQELALAPIPERLERELTGYVRGVTSGLVDRGLLGRKAELVGKLQRTSPEDREAYTALQRELVAIDAERRALRDD